jgi:hypothetical protein
VRKFKALHFNKDNFGKNPMLHAFKTLIFNLMLPSSAQGAHTRGESERVRVGKEGGGGGFLYRPKRNICLAFANIHLRFLDYLAFEKGNWGP